FQLIHAEARIAMKHRRVVNWILYMEVMDKDLLDADLNNFLSFKEMSFTEAAIKVSAFLGSGVDPEVEALNAEVAKLQDGRGEGCKREPKLLIECAHVKDEDDQCVVNEGEVMDCKVQNAYSIKSYTYMTNMPQKYAGPSHRGKGHDTPPSHSLAKDENLSYTTEKYAGPSHRGKGHDTPPSHSLSKDENLSYTTQKYAGPSHRGKGHDTPPSNSLAKDETLSYATQKYAGPSHRGKGHDTPPSNSLASYAAQKYAGPSHRGKGHDTPPSHSLTKDENLSYTTQKYSGPSHRGKGHDTPPHNTTTRENRA
ncbi:hypothetical protein Tco_1556178, partial [Tanacetum coccineum]